MPEYFNPHPHMKISEAGLKVRGGRYRQSFENTADVYIITRANGFKVTGVDYDCRSAIVTKERDGLAKKLFNVLSSGFSKIHVDRLEKMTKNLAQISTGQFDTVAGMVYPHFQKTLPENGEADWWSIVSAPAVNTHSDAEFTGLHLAGVTPTVQQISRQDQRDLMQRIDGKDVKLAGEIPLTLNGFKKANR